MIFIKSSSVFKTICLGVEKMKIWVTPGMLHNIEIPIPRFMSYLLVAHGS